MLALEEERVGLLSTRVLNVVMEVGDVPSDDKEIETSINVDFTVISESESNRPVGIDVLTDLKIDEGSVYSLDLSARIIFDIPDDFSEEDAVEYLGKFGATRAFDCIRPYIEYISTSAGFPMLDLPPVVVTMS